MIRKIKQFFYFPVAGYFRFFARIKLARWNPKVIVITGSSGKTTLLHLIESQLGNKAKYSHHANSSFGIPFDILGLKRKKLTPDEWVFLFLLAPFKVFSPAPKENIYVVEADCDRPGEGEFLASFLNPEITLWISSGLAHSVNFDHLAKSKLFASAEEAIAYEFGFFAQYAKKLVIANSDNSYIQKQLKRTGAKVEEVSIKNLESYKILNDRTEFISEHKKYSLNYIVPKDVFYSIQMTNLLLKYLDFPLDEMFKKLTLPPGRNSIFKGIKATTIIDSSYNATPDGVKTILEMFKEYPSKNKSSTGSVLDKWLVLGDMTELGIVEKVEHEKLATIINTLDLSKIILIGPRVSEFTYPKLNSQLAKNAEKFTIPKNGLDYILKNINGGEVILFKGARFLEGIIEQLLSDKKDIDQLVRRETVWQNRRRSFGI